MSGITPDMIDSQSLAMTSMGPNGEQILNEILFSSLKKDAAELNTVIVPFFFKDNFRESRMETAS